MNQPEPPPVVPSPAPVPSLLRPVLVSALLFLALTGVVYPLATTAAAQLLFRRQAEGSVVSRDGREIGSSVIGQRFSRAEYFHGRPSVTTGPDPDDATRSVPAPYNAGLSAASNLGVLSKSLTETLAERAVAYRTENGLPADAPVPVDAVTASGSGLDPDISVANALLQAGRVARARGVAEEQVAALVRRHTSGPQLGVLGDPRVHVLSLNLALDAAHGVARN